MSYLGDFRLGDTLDFGFTTVDSTGAPATFSGSPAVAAYPGNSTTEITAGITLSVDFDTRTGLNNVRIVASGGNGYATATNYKIVVTSGTAGGTSIVGYVVGHFSIEARSAVMPTTAARTLDVSSGGEAGLDWANIGSPTTTQDLSGTTVGTLTANSDKTGYALSSAGNNSAADALLTRNIDGGSSTGRTVEQALAFLRNKWTLVGTTLTVYDVDDTTVLWTSTIGTDATAIPIVSSDPA